MLNQSEGNGHPLQYSCLEKPHDQRSLGDYSPGRSQRVRHDLLTEHKYTVRTIGS